MKVGILGAGNWGTTFALLIHRHGHVVTLWEYDAEQAQRVERIRENTKFLPGYSVPDDIPITSNVADAIQAEIVVLAVPAQSCREVLRKIGQLPETAIVLSLIKGIEQNTLSRVSEICAQELRDFDAARLAVLSGPTIAPEVAAGLPTSAVVASSSRETAMQIQNGFSTPEFRLYSSDDVAGVELAGALKNVIALAAGMCDGMSLGNNLKGALVTRGLAELIRLGKSLGGRIETFRGLSGLGDLVTTCSAPQSRNRSVGERLGRGETLQEVLDGMIMVAEGVWTARAARDLAMRNRVSVPITDAVCEVLFEGKQPQAALSDLMLRALKAED